MVPRKATQIRLLGPKRETLHLAAAYGLSDAYITKGPIVVGHSPIDVQVLTNSKPVTIADISQEPTLQYREEAMKEGVRSIMVVPLDVRGTVISVMRFYSTQLRRFSDEAIGFAMAVADSRCIPMSSRLRAQQQCWW